MKILADNRDIPQHLYRYRRIDTDYALAELQAAVFRNEVYLSSAEQLNDPFDFCPLYRQSPLREVNRDIKRALGRRPILSRRRMEELEGAPLTRMQFRKRASGLRKGVKAAQLEIHAASALITRQARYMRVACFSEVGDSIPMWAHYTSNHSGFCLKYALKPLGNEPLFPLPVRYEELRPEITTLDLRVFTRRSCDCDDEGERANEIFRGLFLRKALDWKYEREWRIFDRSDAPPRYHPLVGLSVSEVIFGIRARGEDIDAVANVLNNRVCLKRAVPSKFNFSLEFVDL